MQAVAASGACGSREPRRPCLVPCAAHPRSCVCPPTSPGCQARQAHFRSSLKPVAMTLRSILRTRATRAGQEADEAKMSKVPHCLSAVSHARCMTAGAVARPNGMRVNAKRPCGAPNAVLGMTSGRMGTWKIRKGAPTTPVHTHQMTHSSMDHHSPPRLPNLRPLTGHRLQADGGVKDDKPETLARAQEASKTHRYCERDLDGS